MTMLRDYRKDLVDDLGDPREAAAYLTAVLEDGDSKALAVALQDVADAKSLPLPEVESEALCRLKPYLDKAGLRLTVSATKTVAQP